MPGADPERTPIPAPVEAPPPSVHIDKDRILFTYIDDDAPFREEALTPGEYEAYNEVLLHARQFPVQELQQKARRDLHFRDLYLPGRRDFKLELVYFEGRLRQLRRVEPTRGLKEAGIKDLYEGWLFPKDEVNPLCLVITELPEGLKPQENLRADEMFQWAQFAGYSFKLLQYESRQNDVRNPGRNVFRRAPVLLGRSVTLAEEDTGRSTRDDWLSTFLPLALLGFGGMGLSIIVLTWYLKKGDRVVEQSVEARKDQNPFA